MKEMVLAGSALILALAALRRVLRGRIDPRLQYALWLLAAARLLIPGTLFPSPVSLSGAAGQADLAAVAGQAVDSVLDWDGDVPLVAYPGSQRTWTPSWVPEEELSGAVYGGAHGHTAYMLTASWTGFFRFWAPVVWIAGMAVMGLWLLLTNWRLYIGLFARRRRLEAPPDAGTGRLRVYAVEGLGSPCLFGLFRPAVYLDSRDLPPARLRHVLVHEYTHYRHGDHIWALVRGVCLAVHWFNPLVWWAAALSRRDCELACDAGAISRLGEGQRLDYGDTLLAVTAGRARFRDLVRTSTAMNGSGRTMRERIALIAKRPRMLGITLALVLALAASAAACAFAGRAADEPPADGAAQTDPEPDEVLAEVLALAELDAEDRFFPVTWYAREGAPGTGLLLNDFAPFLEDALRSVTWSRAGEQAEPDADHWIVLRPFVFYEGGDLVRYDPNAYLAYAPEDGAQPAWYAAPGAYAAIEAAMDAYRDQSQLPSQEMRAAGDQIWELIQGGAEPSEWIPLLRDLKWLAAFPGGDAGQTSDRLMAVLDELYSCVSGETDLSDEECLAILSAGQGLDGAYAEGYESVVWRMYLRNPDRFVALLQEGMDGGRRAMALQWVKGALVAEGCAERTGEISDQAALSLLADPLTAVYVDSYLLSFDAPGQTARIVLNNVPEDYAAAYSCDDDAVAVVDDNGLVTSAGPGTAYIRIRFQGYGGERELYCYAGCVWETP